MYTLGWRIEPSFTQRWWSRWCAVWKLLCSPSMQDVATIKAVDRAAGPPWLRTGTRKAVGSERNRSHGRHARYLIATTSNHFDVFWTVSFPALNPNQEPLLRLSPTKNHSRSARLQQLSHIGTVQYSTCRSDRPMGSFLEWCWQGTIV